MTHYPHIEERVPTDVVKFGTDWPGVFIRGDDAMGFLSSLQFLDELLKVKGVKYEFAESLMLRPLKQLTKLLEQSDVNYKE